MEVPIKRLPEYKRKVINITENIMEDPEVKAREKVTYPKPKKIEPHEELHDSQNPESQENAQPTPPLEGQTLPPSP